MDGGGDRPRGGGRRPGGAGDQPAPGIAAGKDPRPLPARGVPAGHGGDRTVVGDFDGALRGELACLEELRGQDEPYWTTVAVLTCGLVETAMGRHDAALGHLREARTLAGRFDHAGLSAWSQVQLGILALARAGWRRPGRCWTRGWS